MQALAARKLDKALQIERGKPLAHVACGLHDARPRNALAGVDVEDDPVANVEPIDHRSAHVQLENARLHQGEHAVGVLDRNHLPTVAINDRTEIFLGETSRGMLLEETVAARPIGTTDKRKRPVDDMRRHPVPDRAIVVCQILFGDACIRPIDAIGMGETHLSHVRLAARGLGRARARLRLRRPRHRLRRLCRDLRCGSCAPARVCYRLLPHHLLRRLVFAHTLERRLAHEPVRGPAAQICLYHRLGFDPADITAAGFSARDLVEGRRCPLQRMQPPP